MENQTITVTDLGALKNIIDLACTRGAFRADEMQQVGELYNKLNNFLEAIVAHAQAQAQSEENKGE